MVDFFINLISTHGPLIAYCLLFVSAFVENIFPPIPGDTVTLFGAYLVGRGELGIVPVFAVTVAGSFTGFMAIYYLGLKKGRALLRGKRSTLGSVHRLEKVENLFKKHGPKLVLANRFLSGVRSLVALAAGIGNMPPGKVSFYSLVSISIWNGLIIYAGLTVGANWPEVKRIVGMYSRCILILSLGFIAILLIRFVLRRQRRSQP